MLSDLRDSGSIEQDADVVIMLYRNKQKRTQNLTPGSTVIDLSIAKQRNGPTGDTQLFFNKYLTKFEDYEPDSESFENNKPDSEFFEDDYIIEENDNKRF